MASTQQHIPIQEITDNLAILKDGSYVVILETSAVNFDLLSDNEQLAIISSFAGLLNSLSFSIQIVIRSKQLDISSYVKLLNQAQSQQANPLLKQMMARYRVFIETIIRENEVLDKQFYVVISVSSLELGMGTDHKARLQKAKTILEPRTDHIIRQLGRIGLRASQLDNERLVKLFYDIYNEQYSEAATEKVADQAPAATQETMSTQPQVQVPIPNQQINPPYPQQPITPSGQPPVVNPQFAPQRPQPYIQRPSSNNPFVVEELPDDYGVAT